TYSYQVKDVAPKVFLFGNLGAVQLKNYSVAQIEKMLSDIKADGLAIHLNPAQEAVQPEGTTQFSGVYKLIDKVSKELSKPVYVKEVGHGISATVAEQLAKTKISALDVNGAGGTSWAKIEYLRKTKHKAGPYEEFGIPTADAIQQCRKVFPRTLIATGGIKNGFDVVKSLVLGADVCGMAYPILVAQDKGGAQGVKEFLEKTADEIRTGLFLLGAKNISELKKLKPLQN
ncbi:MAG: alpha-hydroxy-acid oxidizing protein, partial [Candidatus Diapherotrites archaeon]|nr:alpha-hydroxy-acid oxidizing protein [Candidatus Diapherotrites archaeon]